MTTPCGGDPIVCIEFVIRFITEFLKDWTTLAMLLVFLGLLLSLRADRRKALDDDYGRRLEAYDDKRNDQTRLRS
jgi:cbb3-type cytochrome oxidase subunit 3